MDKFLEGSCCCWSIESESKRDIWWGPYRNLILVLLPFSYSQNINFCNQYFFKERHKLKSMDNTIIGYLLILLKFCRMREKKRSWRSIRDDGSIDCALAQQVSSHTRSLVDCIIRSKQEGPQKLYERNVMASDWPWSLPKERDSPNLDNVSNRSIKKCFFSSVSLVLPPPGSVTPSFVSISFSPPPLFGNF